MSKKAKKKPLSEFSLVELHQKGASLSEQLKWLNIRKKEKDKQFFMSGSLK